MVAAPVETTALVLLAASALSSLLFALGVWATLVHLRRVVPLAPDAELPPVSILKPVKGLEEQLEANLRTFFEQDYPAPFELVFASTERDEPAFAVARRVAADYPDVPVRFVTGDPRIGLNPKVNNLELAMSAARHDLVLQSDANVRVRRDYLRRVVSELSSERASLLTSMVVGVGEASVGGALENLQLGAFIAPAQAFALRFFGITCVVGKSMLLRRSELATLGGLRLVADVLAEDFVLGRAYQKAGKKVVLSGTAVENVNIDIPVERFIARHARWLKMRAVISIPGFVADFGANPVMISLLAFGLSGFRPLYGAAVLGIALAKTLAHAFLLRRTRGDPMKLRHLALSPLKDVLIGAVIPYAAVSRSIEWRGVRLRLGLGSALRPDRGPLPVVLARKLFAPFRA